MWGKTICFLIIFLLPGLPAHGENAINYYNLGLASSSARAKIKYFSKALALDPGLADAYAKGGMLYFYQEKFDKVIQDFQGVIRFASSNAEAYRMLGLGCLKSGFYERTIHWFSRAIEMEPEFFSAYANRAEAYRLSGRYEEAYKMPPSAFKLSVTDESGPMLIEPELKPFWRWVEKTLRTPTPIQPGI